MDEQKFLALGLEKHQKGDLEGAASTYLKLLHRLPQSLPALNNLASVLFDQEKIDEAVDYYHQALKVDPHFFPAQKNLATCLFRSGQLKQAEQAYERCLQLEPNDRKSRTRLGMIRLTQGRFNEAWPDYCNYWLETKPLFSKLLTIPLWDGSPLKGKRLLLLHDEGFGDFFFSMRYYGVLDKLDGTLCIACHKRILRFVQSNVNCPVYDREQMNASSHADVFLPCGMLTPMLHKDFSFYPRIPYFGTSSTLVDKWKQTFAPLKGFRIGIAWQGNPRFEEDKERSFSIKEFAPLAALPGVQLISLQKGAKTPQGLNFRLYRPPPPFDEEDGFMDTAAIMQSLDLLICSDSAIAHLAGALGIPTWLALPLSPHWFWFLERENSPWYPTLTLFRQKERGNWKSVFEEMAKRLRQLPVQGVTKPEMQKAFREAGAYREKKLFGEAEKVHFSLLSKAPKNATVWCSLGSLYHAARDLERSEKASYRALLLDPSLPEAWSNRGISLSGLGKVDEALHCYEKALEIKPRYVNALLNKGATLIAMRKVKEAKRAFGEALAIDPKHPQARTSLGITQLTLGDFQEGWKNYCSYWEYRKKELPPTTVPLWKGSPLTGKKLLLLTDQGFGDSFLLSRYFSSLIDQGIELYFVCRHLIVSFMRSSFPDVKVSDFKSPLPQTDAFLPLGYLPALMKTTSSTIPQKIPYLQSEPDLISQWREVLDSLIPAPTYRVGIAWSGNPDYPDNKKRSIPLELFTPLAQLPGVQLISLQKQVVESPPFPLIQLESLDEGQGRAFMDTAAVMQSLDLVISSDTSIAHLAGGFGVPTWIMLSYAPYWLWMLEGNQSPWYPSVQLFRQQHDERWEPVLQQVTLALKAMEKNRGKAPS